MNDVRGLVVALVVVSAATFATAKGGDHHSSSSGPGTGSSSSSTHVHGYTKKDGTYVEPHQRSTPDKKFENNWTTKGNENPHTGKDGSQLTDPASK